MVSWIQIFHHFLRIFFYVFDFIFRCTCHTNVILLLEDRYDLKWSFSTIENRWGTLKKFEGCFKMNFSSKNWSKLENELWNSELEFGILGPFFYVFDFIFRCTCHMNMVLLLGQRYNLRWLPRTIESGWETFKKILRVL